MRRIWKGALTAAGFACVALAVAGIVLPLVPTTPFLLLAAFFFARSSDRFYRWLLEHRWFGETIRNFREGRGIPLRQKVATIAIMWATTLPTGVLLIPNWWGRIALWSISAAVTVYLTAGVPTTSRFRD